MLVEEAKRGLCTGFYMNPTLRDPSKTANKHRKSSIFPFRRATLIFPGDKLEGEQLRLRWNEDRLRRKSVCVWVCMCKWKDCPSSEHQFSTLQESGSGAEAEGGRIKGPTASSPSSTSSLLSAVPQLSLQSLLSLLFRIVGATNYPRTPKIMMLRRLCTNPVSRDQETGN